MKLYKYLNSLLIVVLPLGFNPDFNDSSKVNVTGIIGGGQFGVITRNCSGDVMNTRAASFYEVCGGIEYETQRFTSGVNISLSQVDKDPVIYASPYAHLNWQYFGIGVGPHLFKDKYGWNSFAIPNISLRLGNRDDAHFLIDLGNELPLMATGRIRIGIGYKNEFWLGVSTFPSEALGLATRHKIQLNHNVDLLLGLRAGFSEGVFEPSASVGLKWSILN